MADAGRRLIPEGATNREEDVPAIEANFQEVCKKEKKFLLWRKSSYPSALKQNRGQQRGAERGAERGTDQRAGGRVGANKAGVKIRAGSTTELELATLSARLRGTRSSLPGNSLEEDLNEWEDLENNPEAAHNTKTKKPHFWSRQKSHKGKGSFESVRSLNAVQDSGGDTDETDVGGAGGSRGIRKSSSGELAGAASTTLERSVRYGAGNLPAQTAPVREQVRLRHVEEREMKNESARESWFKGAIRKSETALHDLHQSATSRFSRTNLKHTDRSISVDDAGNLETVPSDDDADDSNEMIGKKVQGGSATRSYSLRHNLTLPGLSLSRPSNYPSAAAVQQKDRARRTAKSDFFSFQNHLANWRHSPSDENKTFAASVSASGSKFHSSAADGGPSSPKSFADLRPTPSNSSRDAQSAQETSRFSFKPSDLKSTFNSSIKKQITPTSSEGAERRVDRKFEARDKTCDQGVQTLAISDAILAIIDLKILNELKDSASESGTQSPVPAEGAPPAPPPKPTPSSRRTSLDRGGASVNEDCSPSVGDKLLRYLKMARNKNAGDKPDRFRTCNYDRNLRFIKAKGPIEDENEKGVQTNESWLGMPTDPNLFAEEPPVFSSDSSDLGFSSRDSFDAGEVSQGQSFLSQLFSGLQHAAGSVNLNYMSEKKLKLCSTHLNNLEFWIQLIA